MLLNVKKKRKNWGGVERGGGGVDSVSVNKQIGNEKNCQFDFVVLSLKKATVEVGGKC